MEKNISLHFEGETEVLKQEFSIGSFMAYNDHSTIFSHKGKDYRVRKKVIDMDVDPICVDLYLELIKP